MKMSADILNCERYRWPLLPVSNWVFRFLLLVSSAPWMYAYARLVSVLAWSRQHTLPLSNRLDAKHWHGGCLADLLCHLNGSAASHPYHTLLYHTIPYHPSQTYIYHTMGVLPSTQPEATLGSGFILSLFDLACTCCVPYVEYCFWCWRECWQ